ncbi:polysaccharide biosynthesis/export family protein [Cobetia crustatorum]|uniref:Polysaccharide export protein n=1 Tax=Cobetia crustatorum TaxID=553385 RepID=A0A558HQE7_9GAMM|nr:polysaccharide biosynthesis/export family protein [Cobetia crustatorum]TVU71291.1 polysaccharide export protein [Cobetia crustatorum]
MTISRFLLRAGCLVAVACLNASPALAAGLGSDSILSGSDQASSIPEKTDSVDDKARADYRTGTYGPITSESQTDPDSLPPFGENLFTGGFRGMMADGLNSSYTIKPGDQITLRVWGGVEMEKVLPVDAQGNIFLPGIGPIQVQGTSNAQLDSKVRGAIQEVYPENVSVYTNLQGVQPVGVFVTGYVKNPGRYAGTPNDSMLYFLDQAGGIDQALGSYRSIKIKRNGRVISNVDLYDFLLDGEIARPQFRDGDTVVVEERGPAISVVGDVERDYRYELNSTRLSGEDVNRLARLKAGVSHVLLRGSRTDGPISRYLPIAEFRDADVRAGDEVLYSADQRDETIVVQLEGSFYGPSRYALPRDAHLGELLNAVGVPKGLTDYQSVSIRRESVKEQQAQALQESLKRLQTTYLGASSSSTEEAQLRVQEAEMIEKFVDEAKKEEPTGRLVVARGDGDIADVRLQDGDVITIPEVSDSLLISGEVLVPQAVVYTQGMTVLDYIESAGGFTQRADEDQLLVVRQNGAVRRAEDVDLRSGDQILVLPQPPTKNLQLAATITQILYQVAVATAVAINI